MGVIDNMQISESTHLANKEKKFGMSWDRLHSYKSLMLYPKVPPMMPGDLGTGTGDYRISFLNNLSPASPEDDPYRHNFRKFFFPVDSILSDKRVSLCDVEFNGLDRCMDASTYNTSEYFPFARMQVCKSHWCRFEK